MPHFFLKLCISVTKNSSHDMINWFYSGLEINTFFLRCFAGSYWWELMMYHSLFSSSCSTQNSCIFHPPQRKFLSIRCKCGEMSYCVPLLVTCFWTHFLLRWGCCWKSLHYASYPTVCKHHISRVLPFSEITLQYF